MKMSASATPSRASISADDFFSQSSAFAKVIQSRPTDLLVALGKKKKEENKLIPPDGNKSTNFDSTPGGGGDGVPWVEGEGEDDESSKKLGDLIDKLKGKQQVLKSLAQFNQQKNEKELKKNRQELISALPTDPCVLMGLTAVKEELKQCASKIGGVSFSMLPHISRPGATVFRLGVIDLMSVDIVIDKSGAIKHVTVSSSPNSAISPNVVTAATNLFTHFLQKAQFNEFVKYFRGWLSTYIPVIDSVKIRPKLISAISAIESDIETINRSFLNSIDDLTLKNMIKTVIHGTPCGLFQNFPKVCKPTLKYFVSPYDVMKEEKTMESDIEDIPRGAGMIAEIEFYPVNSQNILAPGDLSIQLGSQSAASTPGTPVCTTPSGASTPGGCTNPSGSSQGANKHSVRKMQIAPMVLSEQPLKIGQSLNPSNSAPLPVSFCLMFPKPIPMFSCYVNELHEYTKSLVCENRGDPKQWLYALSVFEGIIPDPDHNYFHALPSCDLALSIQTSQCCDHVTSSNSTYVIQGVMFSHVNALPHIVHIVRKQVALNCLVAAMMRKQPVSNAKQVNMSIPDPGRLRLKFIHPLKSSCIVTVDVQVIKPDFANPSCQISTSDATYVCEDAYPTTILRKCGSLAHLVRSVIRKCSTLRVDITTPSGSSVPSIAPPLTPTIDVKMAISFDRSTMECNDTPPTESLAQPPARSTANSIQNLKLVDMLQSDLPTTALTSLTSVVAESFTYDDSLTSMQIPSGVTSLAGSTTGQQSASGNRKRSRVKSTQDDGTGSHGPGKGKQSKAAKRSMSVAGPLNVPNSPGGSSGNGNNSPALQLQQQIQVLSMMGNPLLPLHMQPTPPPQILTPQPGTPDSSSTFDLGSTAGNSISSPATANANMGDSKLREILNSSKLASASSPVSSSQGQVVPPPPSLQLGAVNFEQLPPISVGSQHNPPTPLLSPSMQEFVYNQQAQAAAFAKISSFAALARQFKPNMYDISATSGLDPSSAAAHLNYQATANAHIQQLLQPALAGVNSANSSSQSSLSGDRSSSNTLLVSGNLSAGVAPGSILHNLPASTIMSSMASEMSTTATAISKQPVIPPTQTATSENDRALKYLGDLWKQLDNKKNLSNSEIEAIERKMNQIQNNLALKDSMNQASNASTSSYKRKNSVDYTDSSSVSSNQSLGDSKNSSDFGSNASIGVSTTPPKRSKNTGPPKRRGRPPKSMMGDPKGHSDSNSPYSQLVPKFSRSESSGQVELSGGSPVKMLKLTPYSSGGSSVGSGKLYTIRSDLDAFEMSDDSSDSGATLMSQQLTPHPVPPPIGTTSGVSKKPKVVKKPRMSKKSVAPNVDPMANSESGSSTTTYKSLNKSDTVIVIKKVGGPTFSQIGNSSSSGGSVSKDPSTSSGVSSMSSPGVQTQSQGTSSQISTSKDFSTSSSLKSESSNFSIKETSSSYLSTSKNVSDSIPAIASSKINPGLENKSIPMKNLFASFAAENSGPSTSVSSLSKSASSTSISDKDKELSSSKSANSTEPSSSFSKYSGADVSTSSAGSQPTSSSMAPSSSTSTSKSTTNVLLSNLAPSKKRVGLESVVSKLNTPPVASSSGSASAGFSTSAALSSTSVSKTIVASTLLKSSSLKLQGLKDNPLGIKSSKSKSFSSEKSKHSSGDKSLNLKSGGSSSKTPGSPISAAAAHLPSFLKSSNKLGKFVIPKKKSGGGGGSSSNDSHKHHFDQSDSSRNSNGSSPFSASDSSTSKTFSQPPTAPSTSASISAPSLSAENNSSKNRIAEKMFDFPLNEDHSMPTPTGHLASKLASKSASGSTSGVSTSTFISSSAAAQNVSTTSVPTLSASSGTIFSGEKSTVSIPLNRIQHPLTSYSVSSASDSSPSLDSPQNNSETPPAKSSSSGSVAPSDTFELNDCRKDDRN